MAMTARAVGGAFMPDQAADIMDAIAQQSGTPTAVPSLGGQISWLALGNYRQRYNVNRPPHGTIWLLFDSPGGVAYIHTQDTDGDSRWPLPRHQAMAIHLPYGCTSIECTGQGVGHGDYLVIWHGKPARRADDGEA